MTQIQAQLGQRYTYPTRNTVMPLHATLPALYELSAEPFMPFPGMVLPHYLLHVHSKEGTGFSSSIFLSINFACTRGLGCITDAAVSGCRSSMQ